MIGFPFLAYLVVDVSGRLVERSRRCGLDTVFNLHTVHCSDKFW